MEAKPEIWIWKNKLNCIFIIWFVRTTQTSKNIYDMIFLDKLTNGDVATRKTRYDERWLHYYAIMAWRVLKNEASAADKQAWVHAALSRTTYYDIGRCLQN